VVLSRAMGASTEQAEGRGKKRPKTAPSRGEMENVIRWSGKKGVGYI